jgi:hypothetical protein
VTGLEEDKERGLTEALQVVLTLVMKSKYRICDRISVLQAFWGLALTALARSLLLLVGISTVSLMLKFGIP